MGQMIRTLSFVIVLGIIAVSGLKYVTDSQSIGAGGGVDDPQIVERGAGQQPAASASYSREMVVEPGRNGQFWVTAAIDGVDVRFLVDTGASHVVLSPRDGERLGLDDGLLEYTKVFQTANGYTRAAPVVLDDVRIGQLQVDGVEAAVNQSQMGASLLGMSFLRELDGFQIENGKLFLYW